MTPTLPSTDALSYWTRSSTTAYSDLGYTAEQLLPCHLSSSNSVCLHARKRTRVQLSFPPCSCGINSGSWLSPNARKRPLLNPLGSVTLACRPSTPGARHAGFHGHHLFPQVRTRSLSCKTSRHRYEHWIVVVTSTGSVRGLCCQYLGGL